MNIVASICSKIVYESFTFESRVKAPTQCSKSTTVIPRCIELLRMIFDRQGILFSTRINRSRREDGKKKLIRTPLPEPSTFFLRLLSPLFFSSLSTGLLSASSSLCVFTEIGEAAGCYFPVPTVWAGVQRLQILLSASRNRCPRQNTVRPVSSPLLLSKRRAVGYNNEESRDTRKKVASPEARWWFSVRTDYFLPQIRKSTLSIDSWRIQRGGTNCKMLRSEDKNT